MKNNFFYLGLIVITFCIIFSCSKDDDVERNKEQYENGKIEFSYSTYERNVRTDTTVVFTSSGSNPAQLDHYGYFDSSIGWCQLMRINPDNIENRTIIFFSGTDLNKLSYPYTFSPGEINRDAQINYVVDSQIITNDSGQQVSVDNTYAATTHLDNFELTILSKVDNRLKGTFQGAIQNQEGEVIHVEKGLFDIVIVEK